MQANQPLLNSIDGPAAITINANGESEVVLVCEHASNRIPHALNNLGLGQETIDSHAAWDPGAEAIALLLSQSLDAPLVNARFSRLVYDLNRPPEHPEAMRSVSEVHHIPGNENLSDEDARALIPLLDEASVEFLCNASVPIGTLTTGHVPLDMDVFPMDNSNSKKEGVAYTYKGHDGYAPIAAYLGTEGWCLGCELRPGNQHANKEFIHTLDRVLPRVRELTDAPLPVHGLRQGGVPASICAMI